VKWIFFARSVEENVPARHVACPACRHPLNNDVEQPPAGADEPAAAGTRSLTTARWVDCLPSPKFFCDWVGDVARLVSGQLLSPNPSDSPVSLLNVNGHFFLSTRPWNSCSLSGLTR
jgi:hypothetical protein